MAEFQAYGSTPRLNRGCLVTEKIDGTNAGVHIERGMVDGVFRAEDPHPFSAVVFLDNEEYRVTAQSRKRLIGPGKGDDNHGFAAWVHANAEGLVQTLGEGLHFGEWWGNGVNKGGYGLPNGDKRWSLFNVRRWVSVDLGAVPGLGLVPVLYEGPFDTAEINQVVASLAANGSKAAPGWMDPEGVVVFHDASRQVYKVTIKNDETPKSLVGK